MVGRPLRQPVDLQAVTRDVKDVIGAPEAIEQQKDPIFPQPRDVLLELVLASHELDAIVEKVCRAW
jgi:hypothetical protein